MNELMPLAKRLKGMDTEDTVEFVEMGFDGLIFTQIIKTGLNRFQYRVYSCLTQKWTFYKELTFERLFLYLDCPSILIHNVDDSNPFKRWVNHIRFE